MKRNLAKTYDPKEFEDRIYTKWENSGAFRAEVGENKTPFTIVMPPPNITGQLHMGHALDQTLQDVLIRWKRMEGYCSLWLPGSDHASIATEVKVANKLLKEEGKKKEDIGREEFLKEAWAWKKKYGSRITRQCRKLGDSCDWERERFTMDEGCSKSVRTFFVNLYKKGLIYRGNRLINWCPSCGTSLSDAEVEHEDKCGEYWYFRYPAENPDDDDMVIATSRPETMFGDVAIAVRTDDKRYKRMVGHNVILPIIGRKIPVVEDPYPDPEKGTGAVKITPAHDFNDFEVGERHGLEVIGCINEDGTMNKHAGDYEGLDRYECRKKWVSALRDAGYLVKTEAMLIPESECYRCGTAIEPMLSDQWFVSMKPLAKPAIDAVESGRVQHVPERFQKVCLRWLNEIKDWCISRQLWWGHRIPAWYCQNCGEIIVSENEPSKCSKCGSENLKQDEDVLDTWFSSALWPFSTLGWPEKTDDLDFFYPTNVLVTGYDIIFFWIVRMIFAGCEAMGEAPFDHVYVHGLVRDSKGCKMSKSLGNGIDPLHEIEKYGADALRFMLIIGTSPGNDIRYQDEKIIAARNFANKLWNASRFVIMNITDDNGDPLPLAKCCCDCCGMACGNTEDFSNIRLKPEDKWMISRTNDAIRYVKNSMDKFELGLAAQRVYDLIWNEFCDWYIEFVKKRLWSEDEADKETVRYTLVMNLKNMISLLHPFMPFITEEIWSFLPKEKPISGKEADSMLIRKPWPVFSDARNFPKEEMLIEKAKESITAIRNIRAESSAAPSKKMKAVIKTSDGELELLKSIESYVKDIAGITEITYISEDTKAPEEALSAVISGAQIFVPFKELVDFEAEHKRLNKEKKRLEEEIKRADSKLNNEGFVAKAPAKLVNAENEKKTKYDDMLKKVLRQLESLEERR